MSEEMDLNKEALSSRKIDRTHEWLANKATNERTRYYSEIYHQSLRDNLKQSVLTSLNSEPITIQTGDSLSKYLKEQLKSKELMQKALVSLQLQGYQVDFFPLGYQVEIKDGKLSIFKMNGEEKEYYKSPSTSKMVENLDLLSARMVARKHLFKSGSALAPVNKKVASSITQAREMVDNSFENGNFTKITGSVNGVKISSRVEVSGRHVLAAKELMYLFKNHKDVLGSSSLSWMGKGDMMKYLEALSGKNWGLIKKMNTPGTKEFKAVRSSDGVLQLTLAWRRARSVMPKEIIDKIRKSNLDEGSLNAIKVELIQTDSISGKKASEDRKVKVETILDKELPEPIAPPILPRTQRRTSQRPRVNDSSQRQESNEVADSRLETERSKIIAKEWKKQKALLDYYVTKAYPGYSAKISEISETRKQIDISYIVDNLKDSEGRTISLNKTIELSLPTKEEDSVKFLDNNVETEIKNFGQLFKELNKELKLQIKKPARLELENFLQSNISQIRKDQNLDSIISALRQKYTTKDLKLEVILGLVTEIELKGFSGGILGPDPIRIAVLKNNNEVGLKVEGGKKKNPTLFYSLESNNKVENEK